VIGLCLRCHGTSFHRSGCPVGTGPITPGVTLGEPALEPVSIRGELAGVDTDQGGRAYVRVWVTLEDAKRLMDERAFGRPVLVVHPAPVEPTR